MAFKLLEKLFLILMIGTLALSACVPTDGEATPTEPGIDAIYTAAAQTVEAQFTGTAAAQPTTTFTPAPTVTGTVTATAALAATNTQAAIIAPPASTGGGAVGCNNAIYVSDVTIPDNQPLAPGTTFTKTWRVQNTGTCAWNANYKLTAAGGDVMGGVTTAINQTVNAGATADVSVTLTAPSTPKTYTGYWKLTTDTGQVFGTSVYVQILVTGTPVTPGTPGTGFPTITPTFGAAGCLNSMLVSTTPADGATVKAGETFRKTWVFKNTGTCDWTNDFKLFFLGGDLMGSDTTRLNRGTVKPGASIDYYLTFTAPNAPGTYTGNWRLISETGTFFGPSFTVKVLVAGATFTPTVKPSVTVTATPLPPTVTPTGTPTVTPTAPAYP